MDYPHILEIYPPGQTETPLSYYESERPVPSIHRGDILHPAAHDIEHTSPGDPLHRVTAVVHFVFGGTEQPSGGKAKPRFKTMVYRITVDGSAKTLLTP